MPWLFLEKDRVWISREKHIKCYKRNNRLGPSVRSLAAKSDADICKFVHKENCVISGLGWVCAHTEFLQQHPFTSVSGMGAFGFGRQN